MIIKNENLGGNSHKNKKHPVEIFRVEESLLV